ncbi:MAG: hypothetical protein GX442_26180 [Candidatus Riflebacteria bacterium]|nr:hypothetical protein [Candidatus Riflebacteria bacterium]
MAGAGLIFALALGASPAIADGPPADVQDAAPVAPGPGQGPAIPAAAPCPLDLLPEMQPLPEEATLDRAAVPPVDVVGAFRAAWEPARSPLLSSLDTPRFVDLSRWARGETTSFVPPARWPETLDLEPLGRDPATGRWLFGLPPERSPVALPAHSPLVFRRVVAFAWFDPGSRRLDRVILTIRGWREE